MPAGTGVALFNCCYSFLPLCPVPLLSSMVMQPVEFCLLADYTSVQGFLFYIVDKQCKIETKLVTIFFSPAA